VPVQFLRTGIFMFVVKNMLLKAFDLLLCSIKRFSTL